MGKPQATVIASSPRFTAHSPRSGDARVINAAKLADDTLFTTDTLLTPKSLLNSRSNSSVYLPEVSQKSRELETRLVISSSP